MAVEAGTSKNRHIYFDAFQKRNGLSAHGTHDPGIDGPPSDDQFVSAVHHFVDDGDGIGDHRVAGALFQQSCKTNPSVFRFWKVPNIPRCPASASPVPSHSCSAFLSFYFLLLYLFGHNFLSGTCYLPPYAHFFHLPSLTLVFFTTFYSKNATNNIIVQL